MSELFKRCPNCGSKRIIKGTFYYHCRDCKCDFTANGVNGSTLYHDKSSNLWVHTKPNIEKIKVVFS